MKNRYFFLFGLLMLWPATGKAAEASFTVAELFTSQSCSSCPPADALLGELAKNPSFIALGCHVTYWDRLNWRDTLSLPACTARQADYNKTLDAGVFTPQLIVNGQQSMVGSDAMKVRTLGAMKMQGVYRLDVKRDGDRLRVDLPAVDNVAHADLVLVRYGDPVTQKIGAGENGGRTVTYTNPVLSIDPIGQWNGPQTLEIPLPKAPGHLVVLAQLHATLHLNGRDYPDGDNGRIVGAGQLDKP